MTTMKIAPRAMPYETHDAAIATTAATKPASAASRIPTPCPPHLPIVNPPPNAANARPIEDAPKGAVDAERGGTPPGRPPPANPIATAPAHAATPPQHTAMPTPPTP